MRILIQLAIMVTMLTSVSRAQQIVYYSGFEGPPISSGSFEHYDINDLYIHTAPNPWVAGAVYCELDHGILYNHWVSGMPQYDWACYPGINSFDSWFAPGIGPFGDAHELCLEPGFSGDPTNADVSLTFTRNDPDAEETPWNTIQVRLVFTPDSSGKLAFRVGTRDASGVFGEVVYTGTITDGRIDWPQPIPGDLTFDGFADKSDLEVLKEHWGADPIILGDLGSGDASYDGAVTSADLDIIRANWAASPPASAVPEPGILVLAGMVAVMFAAQRAAKGEPTRPPRDFGGQAPGV